MIFKCLSLFSALCLVGCSTTIAPTPTLERPTPRPTLPPLSGTPVPVTKGDNDLIEQEPGPLYVMVSAVDEHGIPGGPLVGMMAQPDPTFTAYSDHLRSGTVAQVLEIRRLPPDFLRSFYKVTAEGITGWVGDYYIHRTVFVVVFDQQQCACPFPVALTSDMSLTQPITTVLNLSPLRIFNVSANVLEVQALSGGQTGWVSRAVIYESVDKEFIRRLVAP